MFILTVLCHPSAIDRADKCGMVASVFCLFHHLLGSHPRQLNHAVWHNCLAPTLLNDLGLGELKTNLGTGIHGFG